MALDLTDVLLELLDRLVETEASSLQFEALLVDLLILNAASLTEALDCFLETLLPLSEAVRAILFREAVDPFFANLVEALLQL